LSVTSASLFDVRPGGSAHTLIVPSKSAVASFVPSPEKAIAEIEPA
jgi:hypothetical protein